MRTQMPNERLSFNGQLGAGALGSGPMTQNTDQICLPGDSTDQICFMQVIKEA